MQVVQAIASHPQKPRTLLLLPSMNTNAQVGLPRCNDDQITAQLYKKWRYKDSQGNAYTIHLENGLWSFQWDDDLRRPCNAITQVRYFWDNGLWRDLDDPSDPKHWRRYRFQEVALRLLPHVNDLLYDLPAHKVKGWSHEGATVRYGDVGNRTMCLVVDVCLRFRQAVHEAPLYQVSQRGLEKKADLLEAVMGLRVLYPAAWQQWGDAVDHLCTDVYEVWRDSEEEVRARPHSALIPIIFDLFGLDDHVKWHFQKEKSNARMACFAALPNLQPEVVLGFM